MISLLPSMSHSKGWGSFHSPSVETLIHQAEEDYTAPIPPIQKDIEHILQQMTLGTTASSPPSLSLPAAHASLLVRCPVPLSLSSHSLYLDHGLMLSLFPLSPSFTFLNHGAFGVCMKPLLAIQQRWMNHMEEQPLRYMDREMLPLLVDTIRHLSRFLHTQPQRLVLTLNVTTALTCIIRSLISFYHSTPLPIPTVGSIEAGSPSYTILRLNIAYGAVKKMTDHLAASTDSHLYELQLSFPTSHARLLAAVAECITSLLVVHPISVAFFDHVASNTALVLPIKALVEFCHRHGICCIIDGAHGPWSCDLDLSDLQADVYTGNCHKWLCNPKGCAFLYVAADMEQWMGRIQPPVISHGYGSGFTSDFIWVGSHDYSAWLTLHSTLQLWNKMDIKRQ